MSVCQNGVTGKEVHEKKTCEEEAEEADSRVDWSFSKLDTKTLCIAELVRRKHCVENFTSDPKCIV